MGSSILSHVLHTDGTFPDGPGGGGQELLVVRLAQQRNQWLQTFVLAHQVTGLLVLCTLQAKREGQLERILPRAPFSKEALERKVRKTCLLN